MLRGVLGVGGPISTRNLCKHCVFDVSWLRKTLQMTMAGMDLKIFQKHHIFKNTTSILREICVLSKQSDPLVWVGPFQRKVCATIELLTFCGVAKQCKPRWLAWTERFFGENHQIFQNIASILRTICVLSKQSNPNSSASF